VSQASMQLGDSGAEFSLCGRYRYLLWRTWSTRPRVLWVMLNPSTADEQKNDPTVRRCIGFTQSWGYGGIVVANLYAFRATDPRDLPKDQDEAVGPRNVEALTEAAGLAEMVVAAWGQNAEPRHALRVSRLLTLAAGGRVFCLGRTKDGLFPRHPLYVRGDAMLEAWEG